ncbi:ALG5 [[Candida] subhashii]|uniref:dolichyl-phosphate beta-glucosyltransferase n=1 Tax=[Candida] subhashii TaxID=561895 RepID=A0A8J5UI00_9ASCO|nr:ALG5 [[Candida] subhashii]KAG7663303.1 ALG5 [[Candida] subhashii]
MLPSHSNKMFAATNDILEANTMLFYLIGLALLGFTLVYTIVLAFSRTPRLPLPTEDTYVTNDEKGERHDLPPRITTSSKYKDYDIDISLIIPCYNERKRLGKMLDESVEYLEKNHQGRYEILIVDDNSKDGTRDYAIEKATELGLPPHIMRVVNLLRRRGKGGGVCHGLLHARGKYSIFADADGATKFSDINQFIEFMDDAQNKEPSIAIGSRRAVLAEEEAVVKRSLIRRFMMLGLHTLVFVFGIREVDDTQCGFKMFNFEAVKRIFPHLHNEKWIFDFEVLLLGEYQSMRRKEIPVNWQEMDGSKIDLARDSIEMAKDLIVTRLAYMMKIYKLDECGQLKKARA